MTCTQWLCRPADPAAMLQALDLADDYASTAGTLSRLVAAASPWAMLLPFRVWVGSYGLLWALETGRLMVDDAATLRTLSAGALCRVVADAGTHCDTPLQVVQYMTARALGHSS
jgi:hypothetical protein